MKRMRSFRATSPAFHLRVRRALVMVVCTAMLAAACSSGGSTPKPTASAAAAGAFSAPPPPPAPPAAPSPMSGTWAGTLTSYRGDVAAFTVDLQQKGSAFVGQLLVPTANCNKEAKVTGTLAGGKVDFGVSQGADLTGNFTGTVSGTTMSGTWSGPAGGICGSDHGTWTGKKVS